MEKLKHKHTKNKFLKSLTYLTLVSLYLGQLGKITQFNQTKLYLFDILILLYNSALAFYFAKNKNFKLKPNLIFLMGFACFGLISLIFTPLKLDAKEYFASFGYNLRFASYILLTLFIYNLNQINVINPKNLHNFLIKTGILVFIVGLMQLLVLPDLEKLDPSLGFDPHKNRMVSTFFDPNFLGIYFVLCLFLCLRNLTIYTRKTQIFLILLFILGIILTFSRSAWLSLIILLTFFSLKKTKILIPITVGLILTLIIVPQKQIRIVNIFDPKDSAAFRINSWNNTIKIIKENWIFGVGYNAFRYAQIEYGFLERDNTSLSGAGSDSSLLLVWATSGIWGLIFYLSYFAYLIAQNYKSKDYLGLGLVITILINSIFINSLFYPQVVITFLLGTEIKNGGH